MSPPRVHCLSLSIVRAGVGGVAVVAAAVAGGVGVIVTLWVWRRRALGPTPTLKTQLILPSSASASSLSAHDSQLFHPRPDPLLATPVADRYRFQFQSHFVS
jgi:hypothetical protein